MLSPFLGLFGMWLAVAGMCQAGNLDRSSVAPLSIVYTVHPYYNSETLLGVWKAEEPLRVSANVVALGRAPEGQKARHDADATSSDESSSDSNARDSFRNNSNESTHPRDEQATEITYWPPVQRGAVPKPRPARATVLQSSNLKKGV